MQLIKHAGIHRMAALEAAQLTGTFAPSDFADLATALRHNFDAHAQFQRSIAPLRAKPAKETTT